MKLLKEFIQKLHERGMTIKKWMLNKPYTY